MSLKEKIRKLIEKIEADRDEKVQSPKDEFSYQQNAGISSRSEETYLSPRDAELKARIERAIRESGGNQWVLRQKLREIGKDVTARQAYMVIIPTVYNNLPEVKQKFAGLNAVYQFNIEGAGKWHLIFKNGELEVKEGAHPTPNVTITMTEEVRKATAEGKLDPQMAFMSGKIKFAGDMALLMKLGALIRG
jgi:putative sterol carrier protein